MAKGRILERKNHMTRIPPPCHIGRGDEPILLQLPFSTYLIHCMHVYICCMALWLAVYTVMAQESNVLSQIVKYIQYIKYNTNSR